MKNALSQLKDAGFITGDLCFPLNGGELHCRFRRGGPQSKSLVIRFHGAIDRKRHPLPCYLSNSGVVSQKAHQLSVSDPTLASSLTLRIAWYAGHGSLDAQNQLSDIFQQIAGALSVRRTVYMGSSGGGFAALYYSWRHEHSCALALVPQTNAMRYRDTAMDTYAQSCWPGIPLSDIPRHTTLDLCGVYAKGYKNTVIYLQSWSDYFHIKHHLSPFLAALSANEINNFILVSNFWGVFGHGGAVPSTAHLPWLHAALTSPSLKADDLTRTHNKLCAQEHLFAGAGPTSSNSFSPRDLELSRMLGELAPPSSATIL